MKVTYEDHWGSDLKVCNMARVSFKKRKETFDEKDAKLISYLAKHNHWTPFSHCGATLHIKAPIAIARQIFKHKIGFTESEVSRRYVDDEPEVLVPQVWRGRPVDKKQGSSEEIITHVMYNDGSKKDINEAYLDMLAVSNGFYQAAKKAGVCPEQMRFALPQGMFTEWYLSGSLPAWARLYKLRYAPDAQQETQEIARQIGEIMAEKFPISWSALIDSNSV